MSDIGNIEWITLGEAVQMIQPSPLVPATEVRMRIIRRAREGLVKARVRDAVVRTLVPEKVDESPKPNADGVVPLGQPLPVWEWPIQKERRSDHELEEEEWDLPGLCDPNHSWWETGDLEIFSTSGTREGASLFGIEFFGGDILRMRPTSPAFSPPLKSSSICAPCAPVSPPRAFAVSEEAVRRSAEDYLSTAPRPLPAQKVMWKAIQEMTPGRPSRAKILPILQELSGPLSSGPRRIVRKPDD